METGGAEKVNEKKFNELNSRALHIFYFFWAFSFNYASLLLSNISIFSKIKIIRFILCIINIGAVTSMYNNHDLTNSEDQSNTKYIHIQYYFYGFISAFALYNSYR